MKPCLLYLLPAAAMMAAMPIAMMGAQPSSWLDRVAPLITPAQKKAYLALKTTEERRRFEENFWTGKAITAAEYFDRLNRVDANFGSNKPGSGANTDQGRVYLALGPPVKITRLPSSRIFVPLEIWYYDSVPGVLNTELCLIFFQQNNVGFLKLYSPEADTIRALLLPQASTLGLFGPNDDITENDIRNAITTGPAEDEVITASVNVASGIKYSGNEEILGRISSPAEMLNHPPRTEVTSRLITSHPNLDVLETRSAFGGSQVDLKVETSAKRELDLDLFEGDTPVYRNQVRLEFSEAKSVIYMHRIDLLPGTYHAVLTVDGTAHPYPLEVSAAPRIGQIERAELGADVAGRNTPFEFDGRQIELNPAGRFAVVALPHPGKVTWMIRRGGEVVWRSFSEGQQIASIELPAGDLPGRGIEPGSYRIEALIGDDSTSTAVKIGGDESKPSDATVISFNANLPPARRLAFIGHQWMLRGRLDEARQNLNASLARGVTDEARIDLARADALDGKLDGARDQVKSVLAAEPNNFEALTVFAYIETRFQDYAVAAQLYRRALSIQDSPVVRAELAKLPANP